jgi:hypothetical protein
MNSTVIANLQADLQTRWAPSAVQVETAQEMLKPYAHLNLCVMVPIALHYKDAGIWNDGVEVAPVTGVYVLAAEDELEAVMSALPYSEARELVCKIAEQSSIEGTGSYAIIEHDGSWSVFEI